MQLIEHRCLPLHHGEAAVSSLLGWLFSVIMWTWCIFLLSTLALVHSSKYNGCLSLMQIGRTLVDVYCYQPLFVNFAPVSDNIRLVDNICFTAFPLPDDPNTYTIISSIVYCDGSTTVFTQIATDTPDGNIQASPFCTDLDQVFGFAGCDTYLVYKCPIFGSSCGQLFSSSAGIQIFGLSNQCTAMGLSCLRKVEELIRDAGLPDQDFYILPMKLPNRCVTQQLCTQPPNPFYNQLNQFQGVELI